jgi:hypothetical protein
MGKQVSNRHQKNRLVGHARIDILYKSSRFNQTLLICPKTDAPTFLARALGFARAVLGITAMVEVILRSLIRANLVESKVGQVRILVQKV